MGPFLYCTLFFSGMPFTSPFSKVKGYFWMLCVQEEPGGQRALVFDQGDRISQVAIINCTLQRSGML